MIAEAKEAVSQRRAQGISCPRMANHNSGFTYVRQIEVLNV
jgi:hypothetical protein